MKTLSIECSYCGNIVEKPKKEVDRQRKKGRTKFFCSLSCSGKVPRENPWNSSEQNAEHIKKFSKNRVDEYTPFREYMRRMKSRSKSVDVDLPYLKELWEEQDGKCAYTGVDLEHPTWSKSSKRYNYMGSIDRKNSDLGYTKGNIQYVSVSVNWLKNNLQEDHLTEFFEIIRG